MALAEWYADLAQRIYALPLQFIFDRDEMG
jgi:hypothetical protein